MNSTGQNGEKNGYRVILLLVVGLTAFSSAMKELNQLQQFTLETSQMIARWSDKFAPAPVTQVAHTVEIPQTVTVVKGAESCGIKQSLPAVELPWLSHDVRPMNPKPRAVVPRPSQVVDFKNHRPKLSEPQLAKLKKFAQIDIDPAQFDVTVVTDAGLDKVVFSELPINTFKKTRTRREIRINPREHEVFLKSLNRSINLRFAS